MKALIGKCFSRLFFFGVITDEPFEFVVGHTEFIFLYFNTECLFFFAEPVSVVRGIECLRHAGLQLGLVIQ